MMTVRVLQKNCRDILVLSALIFFVTGCPYGTMPPILSPIPIGDLTTENVSQSINQRMENFQTLRGRGRVRLQTWDEKYKFAEVFVLEKPARFRLETLGVFDQPAVFFLSDEQMLSLYVKKPNVYYSGVASRDNLFKLSGINLSVEHALQVFSGNPPAHPQMNVEWGMSLPELKQYYVERIFVNQDLVQRIWFDTNLSVVSRVQEYLLSTGELLLDIAFEDYRGDAGAYAIPARILIDRPLDKTRMEILYKSLEINQPIDTELFEFPPPNGAIVRHIDDTNAPAIEHLEPYKEFVDHDK